MGILTDCGYLVAKLKDLFPERTLELEEITASRKETLDGEAFFLMNGELSTDSKHCGLVLRTYLETPEVFGDLDPDTNDYIKRTNNFMDTSNIEFVPANVVFHYMDGPAWPAGPLDKIIPWEIAEEELCFLNSKPLLTNSVPSLRGWVGLINFMSDLPDYYTEKELSVLSKPGINQDPVEVLTGFLDIPVDAEFDRVRTHLYPLLLAVSRVKDGTADTFYLALGSALSRVLDTNYGVSDKTLKVAAKVIGIESLDPSVILAVLSARGVNVSTNAHVTSFIVDALDEPKLRIPLPPSLLPIENSN